jgi:hypothetical protein
MTEMRRAEFEQGVNREFFFRAEPVFQDEIEREIYSVPIRNRTGSQLTFASLRPSCSCTAAKLGKYGLAPGEETTLEISANLSGRVGTQRFIVYLNDTAGRQWLGIVQVEILRRIGLASKSDRLEIGPVRAGSVVEREEVIEVRGKTKSKLPAELQFAAPNASVSVIAQRLEGETSEGGTCVRSFRIQLQVQPPAEAGVIATAVQVSGEIDGRRCTASLEISGRAQALYTADPKYIFFDQIAEENGRKSQTILIKRTDGQPIGDLTIARHDQVVEVRLGPQAKECDIRAVSIALDSQKLTKPIWGEIRIATGDPIQPFVSVQYAGSRSGP